MAYTRTKGWSDNPTENQILSLFNSAYSFHVMRTLMKKPMTVPEMAQVIGATHYDRIYAAVKSLKKIGLVKIKEYRITSEFTKTAVFQPTVKNIIIKIAEETTISTDTKLVLHNKEFESGEE